MPIVLLPFGVYFLVGAGCALFLTSDYIVGLVRRRDTMSWNLILAVGWMFLFVGYEWVSVSGPVSNLSAGGYFMMLLSFGLWIAAAVCRSMAPTAKRL